MRIKMLLKLYRFTQDMKVAELAEEMDLTTSAVTSLETGKVCDILTATKLLLWLFSPKKMRVTYNEGRSTNL